MFEAMLSSGSGPKQTYPDSGPGPKTLKHGTSDLGYFGEVSASEIFTLNELRRQTDFWGGTDATYNPTWIKMFLSNKVIYFPTQVLVYGVSWYSLYLAGLVYGVDNTGVVPGATATNQLVYASKEKYNFKVRCFKSQVADPANHAGAVIIATSALLKAGEWGQAINAIISPRQSGYTGDNWALYPSTQFLLAGTATAVSQNTSQSDTAAYLGINNTQVTLLSKTGAAVYWLPVLELVSPEEQVYFPIKDPLAITKGTALPVLTIDPSYEDSLIAYRLFNGGTQMGRAINTGDVGYEDPYYRIEVANIKMANAPGLPVVVNTVTYE